MKKMNNKGFSLVELIVVVLIMAIIAVALAPQVMKWVENSRKSTDVQNYGHVAEAFEIAYAKEIVFKGGDSKIATTNTGEWDQTINDETESGTAITMPAAAKTAIQDSMKATLGVDWANNSGTDAHGTMRMRSKRYTSQSVWCKMVDGHLERDPYINEDIES